MIRCVIGVMCAAVFATPSAGCSSHQACTYSASIGIRVLVTDGATGSRLCDAVVTATDGAYVETLLADGPPSDCSYYAPSGRVGTYEVRASHTGYADAVFRDVGVAALCYGVVPVYVSLELVRH